MLVHAGPGAGKTLGALLSFQKMQQESRLNHFMVFCHRNSIISQWHQSSKTLGIKVKEWESCPYQLQNLKEADGWIVTYQVAARSLNSLRESLSCWSNQEVLAIADEAHHLGVSPDEPESPAWGKAFLELTNKSTIRIGLTGTPFRADKLAFCSARRVQVRLEGELVEQISPDLCIEPSELIAAGDVRPLEFHFQDGWVEHIQKGQTNKEFSPISSEHRESWRARNLRRATSLSDSGSIASQLLLRAQQKLEKVRCIHPNAAGLVIAKDIEHARAIANTLLEDGCRVELVHSQDSDAKERLQNFQKNNSEWLVSVDMCSEGFDAPRLRVVAYLTTVVTKSRFLQAITRAIRMTSDLASIESVPRKPSYVFAPADPLLMKYARSWSIAKPYLIRKNEDSTQTFRANNLCSPNLPMEAVNDEPTELIRMRTAELPNFLQR